MDLRGCGTALVTPFQSDGTIDTNALTALTERQIENGIDFLVACGTTAETPTLTETEWLAVIRLIAAVAGDRVPVIAGCTHNATSAAIERAEQASAVRGVAALLTANPYYNKPSQEGQFQHFRAIAQRVTLPVVLYNIPGRAGCNLEPATVGRLIAECPNIRGVKESSGNLQQITELVHMVPDDFSVLAGDDNVALAALAVGAKGLVSVASNEIPAEMVEMIHAALGDDWKHARTLHRKYYPLLIANFWETSPAPVKHVLGRMGLLEPNLRLPLVPTSGSTAKRLDALMDELGLRTDLSKPAGTKPA
jgi:4-hydroxy-tetrahydrodipicolinate synthase